jgi:hypothetical protein
MAVKFDGTVGFSAPAWATLAEVSVYANQKSNRNSCLINDGTIKV